METKDLKFGKNVEKCLDFVSFVEDYGKWYDGLTKRSDFIVGNGRVYTWLHESDIEKICKENSYTPRQIVAINEEFDEDRLQGIWNHTCEAESEYYTEWLLGCSYDDYRERVRLYGRYIRYQQEDCDSCFLEETWNVYDFAWENNGRVRNKEPRVGSRIKYHTKDFSEYYQQGLTEKDLWEKYSKEYSEEIKHRDYLNLLDNDAKNVWGGKYPSVARSRRVAVHEDSDVENLVWYIEQAMDEKTNKDFFNSILKRYPDVANCYRRYDSVKELLQDIDNQVESMTDMRNAVEFVLAQIKYTVDDFRNCLVDRLESEILDFINSNEGLEERLREGLAKINSIEIISETIVTDQRATVSITSAKNIIKLYNDGVDVVGMMVGPYKINKIFEIDDETYFKIGCHLLKLSDVLQKLEV